MTFHYIGLTGPQGVGKTTLAQAAQALAPLIAPSVRILDLHPLHHCYDMLSALLDIPVAHLMAKEYKDRPWTAETAPVPSLAGVSPRYLMDTLPVFLRGLSPDVHWQLWYRATERRAQALAKEARTVIVLQSALRFPVECKPLDMVVELSREGVAYDGSLFNSPLGRSNKPEHHFHISANEQESHTTARLVSFLLALVAGP